MRIVDLPIDLVDETLLNLPRSESYLFIFWSENRPITQLWCGADEDPGKVVPRFLQTFAIPPKPKPKPKLVVSASVIICTRNRSEELARCLASLPNQSRPPDEIIVVDNASSDRRTRDVAEAAGVIYVREDRTGLDFARNTGALSARSDIVAYTDDDTVLDPHWLENLVAAFDEQDIMAVTGLVLPAEIETEPQWLFETAWSFGRGFARIDYDRSFYLASRRKGCPAWEIGAGANMGFRRSIFEKIGLFDERLDVGAAGCSGDSEYWYRVLAAGYTCRYEPSAVVRHYHRVGMDGLQSQIYYYMRGHIAALMVQYERTGDWGNLRRVFFTMPAYYARLGLERLRHVPTPRSRMLRQQLTGSVAGLVYYLRAKRPGYKNGED